MAGRWELVVVLGSGVVIRDDSEGLLTKEDREFRPGVFGRELLVGDMDGRDSEQVPLYVDEPMVFRLGKDWQGEGRKVSGVGTGYFLVIVPADWTRLGVMPVDPEPCIDNGFRAHYFHGSREDRGLIEGFAEHGVSSSVIKLDGERVFDASEQGDLFTGDAPALNAPGMAWPALAKKAPAKGGARLSAWTRDDRSRMCLTDERGGFSSAYTATVWARRRTAYSSGTWLTWSGFG